MPEKKYKLCYPQLGNYDIPIQYFVNNGLHLEYLAPPAMTKRTIELGAKYSPDFVCAPFKCMMGCYIEALEQGANVLIQTGGTGTGARLKATVMDEKCLYTPMAPQI